MTSMMDNMGGAMQAMGNTATGTTNATMGAAAQEAMWKELRLAVEPAAALPLAALRAGVVVPGSDERVLLVVCGANVDLASLGGNSPCRDTRSAD